MSQSSLSYYPAADQRARQTSPRAQSAAAMSRHSRRVHAHARRTSNPDRASCILDRGRRPRISRQCPDPADRSAGRNAGCLRRSHRRIARAGRPDEPPVLDQEQFEKKTQRPASTTIDAGATHFGIAGDLSTTGAIKPARPPAATTSPVEKHVRASLINDTVIFVAPPY